MVETLGATPRTVARTVTPALHRLAVLIGVIAMIAIVGVVLSTRAVDDLTEGLQPASVANQSVLQDLTDLDSASGAWARSGDPTALDQYQQALARLPGHEQAVAEYAADDVRLQALVERQGEAADKWLLDYAQPRVEAAGGPDTFQQQRYNRGKRLFEQVRAAHRDTSEVFGTRMREASRAATWRLRVTIGSVALLALLAWLMVARARSRLLADVSEPLVALEGVVHQMSKDPSVRARPVGPREVRSVASALNDLADAQSRARAVEDKVQEELRVLDTARDDFVSNVSHELRTPLTTIHGYLEMVAEEFEDTMSPRHERILQASRRNVARLKNLIDDLLILSKAENRATTLEVVDLVPLVRDAVTDVSIPAAGRGVDVQLVVGDRPVVVLADRPMLGRAILNLLTNAVKFSLDEGHVTVSVTVEDAPSGRVALVTVQDHGIGIPAKELERLGTRFFRASNAVTNEIAGTGLGLRIVQTIVEKHSGDVRIESEEGRGTRVRVRLPAQSDTA
ncbi:Sensor histidine kinase YycG [Nocardioides dokdonensis FR1436]|uniref:histidine kinase n=1 Tax=Nocardioides dokdonensis FR1436 TaxID=1300347 RepID=A0A1A9GQJ0_9ACTN|nr:ATP-binding protein [Nocardioides dokdonensis]ANH40336.1 Sensor histidine kinase YycG [Nocardioides dokdonensis FR1436]